MVDGRTLLDDWIQKFADEFSIMLVARSRPLDRKYVLKQLTELVSKLPEKNVIYVLSIKKEGRVPVYVGKSDDPLIRWKEHLKRLKEGKGHYSKWRQTLFEKNQAKFDICLSLVPKSRISKPPIPEFPTTIGAVEYQLVELVTENYPGTALNVEGKRR